MKKNKFLIICILLVFCLSVGIVGAQTKKFPGKDEAIAIGSMMKDSVNGLVNQAINEDTIYFGEVLGEKISKHYFEWEYSLSKACGTLNPAERAWELIKLEVYEKQLAEKEGFLPTDEEIAQYSKSMRDISESTNESALIVATIADEIGMTVDQYWAYQEQYEAPLQLIRGRVNAFLQKEGLEEINPDSIVAEVYETEYYNNLLAQDK